MRKRFNNVLGHVCTQPEALNGTSSQNETLSVLFASKSLGLHRHGWPRFSLFAWPSR